MVGGFLVENDPPPYPLVKMQKGRRVISPPFPSERGLHEGANYACFEHLLSNNRGNQTLPMSSAMSSATTAAVAATAVTTTAAAAVAATSTATAATVSTAAAAITATATVAA